MADIYGIAFNIMGGPAIDGLKRIAKGADNVSKSAEQAQKSTQNAIDANIAKLQELDRKIYATYSLAKKLKEGNDLSAAEAVSKRGDALDEERIKLLGNISAQKDLNKQGFGGGNVQGKSFIKTLGMVTKQLGIATIAALAFKAAMNMAKEGENLLYLAHSSGIAAGSFQRAAAASSIYGGSKEGVAGMMSGLLKMRNDLKTGQAQQNGITEAGRLYGVQYKDKNGQFLSPEAILRSAARVMGRWDKGAQLDIKRLLGIEDGTFNLMLEGYDKYIAELKAAKSLEVSEEDLKRWREAAKAFRALGKTIDKELISRLSWLGTFLAGMADSWRMLIMATLETWEIVIVGIVESIKWAVSQIVDLIPAVGEFLGDKAKSTIEHFKQDNFLTAPKNLIEQAKNTNFTPWGFNFGNSGENTTNVIGLFTLMPGENPSTALRNLGFNIGPAGGVVDGWNRDLNEGTLN